MSNNRFIQLLTILLMIASLAGAAMLVPAIDTRRQEPQRIVGEKFAEAMPPTMAILTVMTSVVRGIAVDILWYRANELKDQNKFFEANQLAELITYLQPHYAKVWVFQAWNMAFNISVATKTPDERWDWVNKGIVLLRDKGIPLNPRVPELYKELDWMYFFKIGQFTDDFNYYYKDRLALEWEEVLGAQPEGLTSAEAADQFAKVADAPADVDAYLRDATGRRRELLDRLRAIGYDPAAKRRSDEPTAGEDLVRTVGRINMYVLSPGGQLMGYTLQKPVINLVDKQVCAVMDDAALRPEFDDLLNVLRRRVLVEHYKLDPQQMLWLMHTYGPMDWRHPSAHGCYWASMITKLSEADEARTGIKRDKDIDLLNSYRGVIHTIQDLVYRGRITFDPMVNPPKYDQMPDPRFIPAYDKAMDLAMKYLGEINPDALMNTNSSFADGHANELQTVVQFAYLYGDPAQAKEYYDKLRKLYGKRYPKRFDKTLEDFVHENMVENLDTYYNANQFIQAMIIRAMERGLALGRPTVYQRFIELAKAGHTKWNEKRDRLANLKEDVRDRQRFPPFDQYMANVYTDYMNSPSLSPYTRHQVWMATPDKLRQRVYDQTVATAKRAAEIFDLDPAKAYPEPPGMAQYRKDHPVDTTTRLQGTGQMDSSGNVRTERR